jgi:hypothetical protein
MTMFRFLLNLFSRTNKTETGSETAPKAAPKSGLGVEALEQRITPAGIFGW